ncbi:MAG: phosphatidate cytidylyltransferase [Acidobacteriia bacterium]|nr:phosphatidate cytidylyltransferase [Terriglobia bacterium]
MKRVATAAVLIPIVLLLVLRAPLPLLAAVVAVVAMLALREFVGLVRHYNVEPSRVPLYVLTLVGFAALAAQTGSNYLIATSQMLFGITLAVVAVAFFFLALAMRRDPLSTGFPAAAASAFGFVYVTVPLAMLVQLRQQGSGAFLILYVLIVVWIGDTVAYYTGRALGRHKLAPRISPGKTWEGTLGSLVGAIVCGTLVFAYSRQISSGLISVGLLTPGQAYLPPQIPPLWQFGALSAGINVAAQIGDLAESLIKRGAGVKDSGSILPGHGGILDRIDALLFAAPVIWYYAAFRVLS